MTLTDRRHRFRPSVEALESRTLLAGDFAGSLADATCKVVELDIPAGFTWPQTKLLEHDGAIFYQLGDEDNVIYKIDAEGKPREVIAADNLIELEHVDDLGNGEIIFYTQRLVMQRDEIWLYGEAELWAYDTTNDSNQNILELGEWDSFSEYGTSVDFHESQSGLMIQRNFWDTDTVSSDFWVTDATENGTSQIGSKTFTGLWTPAIETLVELNGSFVFDAEWGAGNDRRDGIWIINAETQSLELIREFFAQPQGAQITTRGPYGLTRVGDEVFFAADNGEVEFELWKTDGTPDGTVLVADINPVAHVIPDQGLIPSGVGSLPTHLTDFNDTLLFFADDDVHGRELWKSDGTADGTVMVTELTPGESSTEVSFAVKLGGEFMFFVKKDANTLELWKSDGTEAGTEFVTTLQGTAFSPATSVAEQLFFWFDDGEHGQELWVTDGSAEGTQLAADIRPGIESSLVHNLIASNGRLLFLADDGSGHDIWSILTEEDVVGDLLTGDVDGNGVVEFADFLVIARKFGQQVDGGIADGDVNEDGFVNFTDFLVLAENFGRKLV